MNLERFLVGKRRDSRTRKGAEPGKREAFSSAACKEQSDAAERCRRKGGRGIPPSHSRHLGTFLKCQH